MKNYSIQELSLFIKFILFAMAIFASWGITLIYKKFAEKYNIVAKINFRTLHSKIVPRGGGIGFSSLFVVLTVALWLFDNYPLWMMISIAIGGLIASVIGFIDDIYEIPAMNKLIAQFSISLYFFIAFFSFFPLPAIEDNSSLIIVAAAMWLFVPLWAVNVSNFIDGIDGLAISASIFICAAMIIVLTLTGGNYYLIITFYLLMALAIGFALFNMPPASIFMGDSGSIFLGYFIGVMLLITVYMGQISFWTWIIILSYFLADTTVTTISRMFLVKKWYGVHRSHAYQNLARVKNDHKLITYGILTYNIVWVLPLAIVSALHAKWGFQTTILAILPPVILTFRFGPRFSSD